MPVACAILTIEGKSSYGSHHIYNTSDYLLTKHFEKPGASDSLIQKQGKNLQKYISDNNISSSNLKKLKKWEQKNPVTIRR